jgi:hypothetical protein
LWRSVYFQGLWKGAVVVMDNLPAHKVVEIEPLIESGACKCSLPITLLS